jgi:choline dehydrogenase-like flavoprotein
LGFSPAGGLHMSAELLRYVRERRGMVSSNVAEAGGFLKTEPNLTAPDIQLHFVIGILEDHGRRLHAHHGFSCHTCLLRPKSRGSIQLASADPADAPLIDPAFYQDPEDLEGMVRGFKLTRRIMDAPSLKVRRGRELFTEGIRSDDEIKAVLRQRSDTIYHPVGSCAIGSVVDHDLKVKGLSGVRVADASIMPTLIGGNTNAPVVAFAEKAVDLISKDNQ